jgi:hypothetical protein
LCQYSIWDYSENITGIDRSTCHSYYCEKTIPEGSYPWSYLDAFNYCMYCNVAEGREQFLLSVANGTCVGLEQYVDTNRMYSHCNKNSWKHFSRDIGKDGIPLIDTYVSGMLNKVVHNCYCPWWDKYGFKCNGNTAFLEPYMNFAEAEIIIIFFAVMGIVNIFICSIPMIAHSVKKIREAPTIADGMRAIEYQRWAVHLLTAAAIFFEILAYM